MESVRRALLPAAALGLLLWTGCSRPVAARTSRATGDTNSGQAAARSKPAARTADDAQATTPVSRTVKSTTQPARIEPYEQTPLYAKIDGYLRGTRRVQNDAGDGVQLPLADIGDRVAEGDVLAEISVPEMEQELVQKKALLTQAEAELEQAVQAVVVARKAVERAAAGVTEAEAGLIRADGEFARWQSELDRIRKLAASGSVSQKLADETLNQFRAAEAAQREAKAQAESARARLGEAHAGVGKAQADEAAARAHVKVAQANVDYTQALLAYARIRAPFPGVVIQRGVDPGHLVRPPQGPASPPLFIVARTDMVRIVTDIPELEAPLVDVGDRAFIRVQALGGEEFEARVTRTAWVLDPSARTLRTEIHVKNDAGRLRPGMYATVRILLDEDQADGNAGSIQYRSLREPNRPTAGLHVLRPEVEDGAASPSRRDFRTCQSTARPPCCRDRQNGEIG